MPQTKSVLSYITVTQDSDHSQVRLGMRIHPTPSRGGFSPTIIWPCRHLCATLLQSSNFPNLRQNCRKLVQAHHLYLYLV